MSKELQRFAMFTATRPTPNCGNRAAAFRLAAFCILVFVASAAMAQTSTPAAAAQQSYERDVAACNGGTLPAPAREACVRAAGLQLDRARGGPPVDTPVTTSDGRATVIAPAGASTPGSATDTPLTTPDGRATVMPQADGQPAP
jgi:hypothetical protein